MSKYLIYCLMILLFYTGCEVKDDWTIKGDKTSLLVVEGLLTNEKKSHHVIISKTVHSLNSKPQYVSGAAVAITDGDSVMHLDESTTQPGYYFTDSIQAVFNKAYLLNIQYEGKEYQAVSYSAPVSPLLPVKDNIVRSDSLWTYRHTQSDRPSMLEINYFWPESGVASGNQWNHQAKAYFYTLSSVDINKEFAPEREKVRFPKEAILIRKQYSLNEDHEAFIRSLLSETDWRGSVFDELQGNVITNLSEGAVGYFAVTTVDTDTVIVNDVLN